MRNNEPTEHFVNYWSEIRELGKSKYLLKQTLHYIPCFFIPCLATSLVMNYFIDHKELLSMDTLVSIIGNILGYLVAVILIFNSGWKKNEYKYKTLNSNYKSMHS